jgi:DSF synthase
MGPLNAFRTLSDARELSAEEFKALGGLEAVTEEGEGENWVRRYAEDTLASHSARLSLFSAFHRQTAAAFDAELAYLANNWVDSMMRMSSIDLARLQRIVVAQNRMLARAKPAPRTLVS